MSVVRGLGWVESVDAKLDRQGSRTLRQCQSADRSVLEVEDAHLRPQVRSDHRRNVAYVVDGRTHTPADLAERRHRGVPLQPALRARQSDLRAGAKRKSLVYLRSSQLSDFTDCDAFDKDASKLLKAVP